MTGNDSGAPHPVPAFLHSRGYRAAFAGCFVIVVVSLLVHMSLGRGFREPSIWSYISAAAAITAAFGIPWIANRRVPADPGDVFEPHEDRP